MTDTLQFKLDFANIEEADDGDTTHYGGSWTLDGVEKRGYGDDRSDSYLDDVYEAIIGACRAKWPGHVCLEDTDEGQEFDDALVNAYDELVPDASGTISIAEVDGLLAVTLQKD